MLKNIIYKTIYDVVSKIMPYDPLEQLYIDDALTWITSGAQIFRIKKPDTPNKHIASYFIIFDEAYRKILLVDHKKAKLWLPPGGHVEPDEDPKDTVKRECEEEFGIKADFWIDKPIFLTSVMTVGLTAGHTDVSLWYVIKGDCKISYKFDKSEFNNIHWFNFDDIPYEKSDPHIKRFIAKLKTLL